MNSRERVLTAFGKLPGVPDRVPFQFDMCRSLTDHFLKSWASRPTTPGPTTRT
jgi:uroporphyrinogen decarboxylase